MSEYAHQGYIKRSLRGAKLLALCILLCSSACSLSIDTTPLGLRSGGAEVIAVAGETVAGVTSETGGAGGDLAGEIAGDDIEAGDGAGESAGDSAGESAGDSAGDSAGNLMESDVFTLSDRARDALIREADDARRPQEIDPLQARIPRTGEGSALSALSPHLPAQDCLIYDVLGDQCLKYLERDDARMCLDWRVSYLQNAPHPWIGDRNTCELGTYHEAGIADFERALNVARRQLGFTPVTINQTEESQRCALAYDVMQRDQLSDFNEGSPCYSEEVQEAQTAGYTVVVGTPSLYSQLHSILSLTRFDGANIAQRLFFRHTMLNANLTELTVGGRGRAMCFKSMRDTSAQPPLVFTYPGAGVNPHSSVKPSNHKHRSVPWSFAISEEVTALQVNLTQINVAGERAEVSLNSESLSTPSESSIGSSQLFGFIPDIEPQTEIAYELDLKWTSDEGPRHLIIMIGFRDCGFTQPDRCDPLDDQSCNSPGMRCVPTPLRDGHDRECVWNGSQARGESCAGLGHEGCRSGMCLVSENDVARCGVLCDPNAAPADPLSCAALCPSGAGMIHGLSACF